MVAGGRELIDTLWNVNPDNSCNFLSNAFRINRYIMECKCKTPCSSAFCSFELIDTLWNVNRKSAYLLQQSQTGINRYIMECK